MNSFKHKISIQVRFKDVDMMGHVNNANYLTYVELARLKYFEEVTGSSSNWNHQDGLILARLEIDYRQPILYEDKIAVYTRCSRIGTKSFDLTWAIIKENTENNLPQTMAEGKAVLVCYDYLEKRSVPVPAERIRQIKEYEGLEY